MFRNRHASGDPLERRRAIAIGGILLQGKYLSFAVMMQHDENIFFQCYFGVAIVGMTGVLVGELIGKYVLYSTAQDYLGGWATIVMLGIAMPILVWCVGSHLRKQFGCDHPVSPTFSLVWPF